MANIPPGGYIKEDWIKYWSQKYFLPNGIDQLPFKDNIKELKNSDILVFFVDSTSKMQFDKVVDVLQQQETFLIDPIEQN